MSPCIVSVRVFLLSRQRALPNVAQRVRKLSTGAASGPHPEERDVVIVGGGPAGLALAGALASYKHVRDSLSITLVEAGDLSSVENWSLNSGSFSNRVSSITNASQAFLKAVGAWDHVENDRTSPIEEMQVWDGVSDARITFTASELGLTAANNDSGVSPQMARLTENLNLQRGLLRHLSASPGIQISDKVKVKAIESEVREGGGWPLIHLSDGRTLRARLLVGADGFNSPVRSYAGISSFGWSYDTQAIVATLSHPPRTPFEPPNTTAYQRFLPTGPIAFLPLSPTASSLVWSTRPPLAAALTKGVSGVLALMINAAFRLPNVSMEYLHKVILEAEAAGTPLTLSQIKDEISWREKSHNIDKHSAFSSMLTESNQTGMPLEHSETLPPLISSIQPGTAASFPLRFNHAESYIGEGKGSRTVLVGDAAHTIHPLAGQGLNLGLGDVECLARCISNTVLQGGDIGSHTALLPYAQERYIENHKIMSACDKLHKLYTTTFEPVVWARSVGLEVINELDSIKAALMLSAGSSPKGRSSHRPGAAGWNRAAQGIEGLAGGFKVASMLGGAAADVVGSGLRQLLKSLPQKN
ncbi:hypothetical protein JAAARDRAFT_140997 [Jaapia argillacea MUCL 33604]|uniref:Ubiquinone biosynthesis monooxygenase COQ6, mitochondrial n=1 Tax=Jaapia argillacea MUCL 33604 TaxID=933084 RepID=A0A067PB48_9AGAM|nr:hypothetical protein JAAARDRAFT_140997 [Jaapia argillacea MUCL 33604]